MEEGKKEKKRVLVTFDIDGTLIRTTGPTSNNLHHRAFSHAFLQVFGINGNIDVIQAANEKLSDLKSKMIEFAKDHAKDIKEGLEVLPGVESLLQALSSRDNVFIGLKMKQGNQEVKRMLVTFDIDGTLMQRSGSKFDHLHQAFSHALFEVFGIHGTIDVIQPHGLTDPAILINTLVHYGVSSEVATEKLSVLMLKMTEYAKANAKDIGEGLEVLPGVEPLLQALSSMDNILIGLVTGNLEEIAWMKLDALGIKKYFSVPHIGGFGSDHIDRAHLVKIAARRAEKLYPGKFDFRVHVGDTPNDIKAAESGGALAVGVCTGIFGKDELKQVSNGGAIILHNLCDAKLFFTLLGI